MRNRLRPRSLAGILLALGCLLFAPLARADYDPLGSGATKFSIDKSFLALMAQNGVKLSATAPAKLKGGAITFPVSGGKFDPTAAKGTVEHEGALVFKAGGKSVPIKALQLKTTQKHSPLSAKVGGSQLKLAQAKSLVVTREGFGDRVKVSTLTLSSKLATRLGKKLRLKDVFKEGLPLGQTLTKANPVTIALLGKNTASFSFDAGIEAKLRSLFVAVNPIFPAEHIGSQFTLPIFGGTISPDATLGTLETSGSLEFLQLGGGQVFWAEDWLDFAAKTASPEVDVQPSPPYGGKLGRTPVASFAFAAPAVADAKARTVAVTGAALTLAPATAATFNEVFAKPQGKDGVFAAGEALGSISFTAQGQ
jgi:hypothetical protein